MEIIYKIKKHWLSSALIVFGNTLFLGIFIAMYYYMPEITENRVSSFLSNFNIELSESTIHVLVYVKKLIILSLLVIVILSTIYHVFLNNTVECIVHTGGVTIKGGILPWKKFEYNYAPYQIHNASYNTSFWAWLFNFGTINIDGTEGITSRRSEYMMSNAKKLQAEINSLVESYKESINQTVQA